MPYEDIPQMSYQLNLTLSVKVIGDQQDAEEHLKRMLKGAVYSTSKSKMIIRDVNEEL